MCQIRHISCPHANLSHSVKHAYQPCQVCANRKIDSDRLTRQVCWRTISPRMQIRSIMKHIHWQMDLRFLKKYVGTWQSEILSTDFTVTLRQTKNPPAGMFQYRCSVQAVQIKLQFVRGFRRLAKTRGFSFHMTLFSSQSSSLQTESLLYERFVIKMHISPPRPSSDDLNELTSKKAAAKPKDDLRD